MDIQSSRIVQAARELLKAHGYFVDNLWHINDIYFLCEQMNLPRIESWQAMEIFDLANSQFDGEYGINWPQLERALRLYVERHAETADAHASATEPMTAPERALT